MTVDLRGPTSQLQVPGNLEEGWQAGQVILGHKAVSLGKTRL